MQIPPVSNEQMSMMNINLNAMALELQQRRAVMSQQEAQIKELVRKVAVAESIIVELEGRLDKLKPVITKITRSEITQTDKELEELDIDGLNLQERAEAYERQKAMIKAAYLPGEPPISRPGKVVLVDSGDEVTNAGDQT